MEGFMLGTAFNLQGHRGARGLVPENTLPSFEFALDVGVSSIETDLHLSSDGVVIVSQDPPVGDPPRLISQMSLAELRQVRVDRNLDPAQFPHQAATVTPLAGPFAAARGLHPFGLPTLDDLFAFVRAYAESADKPADLRARAERVLFD